MNFDLRHWLWPCLDRKLHKIYITDPSCIYVIGLMKFGNQITCTVYLNSWSWSYGSWLYNDLCNQCQSLLYMVKCTRYNIMRLSLSVTWGRSVVFSATNKTDRYDITEILLKVALNTITLTILFMCWNWSIKGLKMMLTHGGFNVCYFLKISYWSVLVFLFHFSWHLK